jgi:tetratricopeptide (TPR) repeat protein/TolB-like protein
LFRALLLILLLGASLTHAQAHATRMVLVLPFENQSKAPGLEWVSESFPEVLGRSLSKSRLFVISRKERLYAFDRLGVPSAVSLSRATLLRIAQEMDVDYVISGAYNYDARGFTASATVIDIERLRLSNPIAESGPITQALDIESTLASNVSREIERFGGPPAVASMAPQLRLDALENYIKGITAPEIAERLRYLKEATRLAPANEDAVLALAKTYFDNRDYQQASTWLARVPKTSPLGSEASFFLGLSAYFQGNYQAAEDAFKFTSQQLPLIEVTNNLGVIASRRGRRDAADLFQKAVSADARDADYHFNLAVALFRIGDAARAGRELKEAINLNPQDTEARSFLQSISSNSAQVRLPLERVKRNYDESSYRQLALEIQNVNELRDASLPPVQHSQAHVTRGNELLLQSDLSQAETEFRESIALDPNNALAHAGLAEVLENRNDLIGARAEANAANRLALSAQAFLVLARLEAKQQRPAAALDYVQRALKIEPGNERATQLQKQLGASGTP